MVLVWHFTGSLLDPALGWIASTTYAATIFGRTGVDLFFVLSGFLIVGILIDNRQSPSYFKTFYIRRAARIFPPYFALMAIYWLCFHLTGPNAAFNANPNFPVQFAAQSLFSYNILMAAADSYVSRGFSVTWSVAIEEQFYLVAPLVLWLTPVKHLRKLIIIVGLTSALLRAATYLAFPKYGLPIYVFTPFRLDCLCAGAFVATIWRDPQIMKAIRERAAQVSAAVVGLACIAPIMVYAILQDIWWHMHVWGHFYLAVLYGVLLMWILLRIDTGVRLLRIRPLQEAGRISYALYLFHSLFLSLAFILAARPERVTNWPDAAIALGALVASVLASYLSYHLLEKPIRAIGHRWRYEPGFPPARPVPVTGVYGRLPGS
ncbi:Peptidoglycan/LPS O-acetylase OafA/YrhL, contains acyltransferase and SGNH-hydrolase domains [Rhodopseudomonas pseudopalustris]|uniref:Peptidoglycan/LPS O-acetylase OafA/YrhL, contains acyltransferase and SGNH-hydrolase domains n=2 Tax=Rhodopseudomonas pseudopalustris TaxID=1513892 RepID=A0A1H8NUL2_9BRAD|nr:Peptidoglycan/LPS O-acetylase OafA/YrhL, contains acyltransferase and SGNH-hydrolase domains [Rhodopseudomonas pseudopalustris]